MLSSNHTNVFVLQIGLVPTASPFTLRDDLCLVDQIPNKLFRCNGNSKRGILGAILDLLICIDYLLHASD